MLTESVKCPLKLAANSTLTEVLSAQNLKLELKLNFCMVCLKMGKRQGLCFDCAPFACYTSQCAPFFCNIL